MDKKLKNIQTFEHTDISDVIDRFKIVNQERNSLNNQIREYYTPLLTNAAKSNDKSINY